MKGNQPVGLGIEFAEPVAPDDRRGSRRNALDQESAELVQNNAASALELAAVQDTIAQQGARARDIEIMLDRISQQLDAAGEYLGSAQSRLNE